MEQTIMSAMRAAEVARLAGVSKDTLLRWLRAGLIPEPARDPRGWRLFEDEEVAQICAFARAQREPVAVSETAPQYQAPRREVAARLSRVDWDFIDAKTSYLTHGLHPYPAKYIPQIPNALIQELSSVGDTVADVFCGSGTTLVEALLLKRHAIGIDASPLASLISRAKTARIAAEDGQILNSLSEKALALAEEVSSPTPNLFFSTPFESDAWRPSCDKLQFWFDDFVIEELAEILSWCQGLQGGPIKDVALTAFSAIVVAVSKQDSDTRYVRREKGLSPGDALRRFARSVRSAAVAVTELSDVTEERFTARIVNSDILSAPDVGQFDLMVCSPPYPNAYSYHLYHRTRMLWLGMDQATFKNQEIGSHRKYSSKSKKAADVDTFYKEMKTIMEWVFDRLTRGGYACYVVGNSIVRGEPIDNAHLLARIGREVGFEAECSLERVLNAKKKSFNPKIGKIKKETVLVLRRP